MGWSEQELLTWFAQYAYEPMWVYSAIVVISLLASFGLPVPEEIMLVSVGMVCYMGSRPDLFPPVEEVHGDPLNVYVTATVAFCSVFFAEFLVFSLGRHYGMRLFRSRRMSRFETHFNKASVWTKRYGAWAAGLFRFTPGLRLPGFFSCGMLGLSPFKFTAVDGFAALVSVPSQVLLVAYFGETILSSFKKFKLAMLALLTLVVVIYYATKMVARWRQRHQEMAVTAGKEESISNSEGDESMCKSKLRQGLHSGK